MLHKIFTTGSFLVCSIRWTEPHAWLLSIPEHWD